MLSLTRHSMDLEYGDLPVFFASEFSKSWGATWRGSSRQFAGCQLTSM